MGKISACEHLIRHHEARGDKTLVFSDNIFALLSFARILKVFIVCVFAINTRAHTDDDNSVRSSMETRRIESACRSFRIFSTTRR
jgi:hypothetical protein